MYMHILGNIRYQCMIDTGGPRGWWDFNLQWYRPELTWVLGNQSHTTIILLPDILMIGPLGSNDCPSVL